SQNLLFTLVSASFFIQIALCVLEENRHIIVMNHVPITFTGLPKELRDLPDNYILDSFKNIGILAGSNPSLLKKLEINRVQDQLVGKNKAELSDFMGKGVVEDEDNGFKNLKKLRYIWGDANGFKWALVSVAKLDRILLATEWEGKYPRASEIIAKLDDLDKRAEVVLGIKERRKNRIFQMTDGARMESPFKAYDKVFQVPGSEVPKGIAFFLARGGKWLNVAIIIETGLAQQYVAFKGGPRVNKVFITALFSKKEIENT
ncbi:hypothetical protein ACJX0J_016774, partial [Zea mays]